MATEGLPLEERVGWFLDHLKNERAASAHTIQAYERDLVQAVAFFAEGGLSDWDDLKLAQVASFESTLGPPLARSTAQRKMSALRSFLKFLRRNGEIQRVALPETGGFKKPQTAPKALSVEQVAILLSCPDLTKATGVRDRAMLEMLFGAGLRASELVGLAVRDLDLETGSARILGKRGKARLTPLPDETLYWVRRYLENVRPEMVRKPIPNLFLSVNGRPVTRQYLYALLARYAKRAGIKSAIGPHTLRHSYAVALLKGGADLRAVQELLGHDSIASTQVYTKLDMDEVRKRYESAHPRS